VNVTTIQPLSLYPTPFFGGQVEDQLITPPLDLATGLGTSLRATWWSTAGPDGAIQGTNSDLSAFLHGDFTPPSPALDLTAHGSPVIRGPAFDGVGQTGKAKWQWSIEYNGVDQYHSHADHADLRITGANSVTFLAWVRLSTLSNFFQPIISKRVVSASAGLIEYELGWSRFSGWYWTVILPDGSSFFVQAPAASINTWYALFADYDAVAGKISLQVNAGAPVINSSPEAGTPTNGNEFRIGAGAGVGFFQGRIDEVTYWQRIVTEAERQWLLQNDLWQSPALQIFRASNGGPLIYSVNYFADLPAAPSDLALVIDVSNQVDLDWTVNAFNADQHEIQRSMDGGSFEFLDYADHGESSYHDDTADTSAHAYVYRVRAVNAYGQSDWTDEVNSTGFVDPEGGRFVDPEGGGIFQDPEA